MSVSPGRANPPVGPVDTDRPDIVRYRREYAARRRRQALSVVPVGVLGVLVSLGGGGLLGLSQQAGIFVAGAVILAFFGYSLVNWRCPACDGYLGQRLNPRQCPSCGQALRE